MLTNEELKNINGGGTRLYIVIGGIVTFLIGLLDGIFRPSRCN